MVMISMFIDMNAEDEVVDDDDAEDDVVDDVGDDDIEPLDFKR